MVQVQFERMSYASDSELSWVGGVKLVATVFVFQDEPEGRRGQSWGRDWAALRLPGCFCSYHLYHPIHLKFCFVYNVEGCPEHLKHHKFELNYFASFIFTRTCEKPWTSLPTVIISHHLQVFNQLWNWNLAHSSFDFSLKFQILLFKFNSYGGIAH